VCFNTDQDKFGSHFPFEKLHYFRIATATETEFVRLGASEFAGDAADGSTKSFGVLFRRQNGNVDCLSSINHEQDIAFHCFMADHHVEQLFLNIDDQ